MSASNEARPAADCFTGTFARMLVRIFAAISARLARQESIEAVMGTLSVDELVSLAAKRLNDDAGSTTPDSLTDALVGACEQATFGKIHYSQEGEDICLSRLFGDKRDGFFIDVGAHHPIRFSNTYALYRRGWRGVNIDATPGSMAAFRRFRPEDTNIECAVSDQSKRMTFHTFKEGALNTFDRDLAASYVRGGYELLETVELTTQPLATLLDDCVGAGQNIDVLSIDVEGSDLAVLKSNDWQKYSPDTVIIEALDTAFSDIFEHPCVNFLAGKGYEPIARLTNSILLRRLGALCRES